MPWFEILNPESVILIIGSLKQSLAVSVYTFAIKVINRPTPDPEEHIYISRNLAFNAQAKLKLFLNGLLIANGSSGVFLTEASGRLLCESNLFAELRLVLSGCKKYQ